MNSITYSCDAQERLTNKAATTTSLGPRASISPATHNFGTTPAGQRGTARVFTITNTGTVPITNLRASVTNNTTVAFEISRNLIGIIVV